MGEDSPEEDSSDSSGDESEEIEISHLLEEVNTNPYQYDAHLKLITLLRQTGELEKLRQARQNMSELFPLTGELWMQWIQDELKLLGEGDERERIMDLFERAVKDYLAVDVWLEYCQFSVGGIGTSGGVKQARNVFEAAIMAAGLHVAKGSCIWEVYREFENALLSMMQPEAGSIPAEEKQKEVKEQMKRISNIFKRQLAIPLLDMEQTFCEYDQWMSDIGEEIPTSVKESYQKALDMLDDYKTFEEKLMTAEAPKLVEYLTYIEHEHETGNPARIQIIYERALEANCLNMSLWKDYVTYLDDNLKIKSVILPVYERAVRNCPWSPILWQRYLRALERHEEPFSIIQSVFEKALVAGFSAASDYLQLWQTYTDYLRRRIDWEADHEEELETLRDTVGRAIVYQAQYFGMEGDPSSSLQQYLAFVEAKYCKNVERMRELWNDIMSVGHGSQARVWLLYVNLERCYGDSKHVRKVFHRAIHSVNDWPETVFEAFLNFEREEGTLDTWCSAVKRVETQMKRVTEQRKRAAEDEAAWSRQVEERRPDARNRPRSERKGGGKRLYDEAGSSKQIAKKQRTSSETVIRGNVGTSTKPSSSSLTPPSSSQSSTVSTITSPSSSSSVFKVPHVPVPRIASSDTAIQAESSEGDQSMSQTNTTHEMEEQKKQTKTNKTDHVHSKDPQTVFVKNLDYNLTEETIREKFSECGSITEIRMVTNYQKKFKGYCYIEFQEKEGAQKALKMDRELLGNRPMYVDPSRDTAKVPGDNKFKYENKMEKNKLFLSGLPRSLSEEELEKRFSQYGKLKGVRLVTFRSGTPKGLAYVEYEDEACASKAVMAEDNTRIGEHTMSVAISNPPVRKTPQKDTQTKMEDKPLGAKGVIGPRGKGRTQVSLVPRSLQRHTTPKPKPTHQGSVKETNQNGDKGSKDEARPTKLTNADFSNLFLK
ncbi:squamous cell carcinoma antigen recognized by T-cells 3-like [Diadema antillarum]|uniref:squamous cell carcinoma antigen recognized by T-cells 3-like n=1 Tax=Diadema antillarum TaxID=105358 RepID=UPI003A869ED0